jgi:hypothetical protein
VPNTRERNRCAAKLVCVVAIARTDIGWQLVISFRAGASPSRVSLKICYSVKAIADDDPAFASGDKTMFIAMNRFRVKRGN